MAAYQGHAPVPRDPRRARAAAGRLAEPEQRRPVAELLRALGAQRRRSVAAGSPAAGSGAAGSGAAGTSAGAAPRAGSAPAAAPGNAAGAPVPVLDAHARQQLVERAMGKSTRQVQQMLAEVDPEAAAPAERLRPLGDGRWELKAVVDAECQRGLQQLRELLSHVDPHLTVGQLVGRLVREGVERYDPSRPPRRKRRKSDPAGDQCSAETAGGETADRVAAAAKNPRRAGKAAATDAVPGRTEAIREGDGSRHFAGRACQQAEALGKLRPREASGRRRAAVLRRRSALRRVQSAPGAPAMRWRQSRLRQRSLALLPAVRLRFRTPTVRDRRSRLRRRSLAWQPAVRSRSRAPTAQDRRSRLRRRSLAWPAARDRPRRPRRRSQENHPADRFRLRSSARFGGATQGCCSYVDRHTGRRCGSRFFLEIDHIVPVARGGGAEPANLRLRCSAHHRFRHGRRQRSAPRDSVT